MHPLVSGTSSETNTTVEPQMVEKKKNVPDELHPIMKLKVQTQNYLTAAHQREQVLLAQRDADRQYYDKQMTYMSNALSILLLGFRMPVRETPTALPVPSMPPPPGLPPRYRPQPLPPPSEPEEDEDATDLSS
ncbi:hypothetical protein TorRG33x02_186680 [Trema orientale]|uniref:Uncharacterized protein n=1 Tax=Trema orientale TaxID=63057 RepID=A0A2P5EIZ9_TREOI|nr:hypothetical protein TorRG33x02_186680 [Trema orientale]